jgi:hypothetical protein
MKSSVIAYETELTAMIRRYLDVQLGFDEVVSWVDDHELSWAEFEFDSVAGKLATLVMSLHWEDENGDHSEESLRRTLSTEFAEIVGSRASP